jgi:3-hydroxybutyryl-CoA dehydrogenase
MDIKKVFVLGAGTMGHGIAQVCSQTGLSVTLCDVSKELVDKAKAAIGKNLTRAVSKGKMSEEDKTATLQRIQCVTEITKAAEADMVVEAVLEDIDLKRKVFAQLDETCRQGVILATNTSSQSITEIAAATKRPEQVIGMHFFNPVPVMKLIEIIRGLLTSDETYRTVEDLSVKLGKTPVEVNDYPGFATSRLLMVMLNEAFFAYWQSVGSAKDIDTAMKLGMNHPMGPLELADLIGLDICLNVMNRLYQGFNDSKYRPCPLLKNMVAAGLLGRKSGRGFYTYDT